MKFGRDPAKSSSLNQINWLLKHAEYLNDHEQRFLPEARDLLLRDMTLSRRQYAWLNKIYDREYRGLRRHRWWEWMLRALFTRR